MSFRIPLSAPDIGAEEIAAVTSVLQRSQLSLGPELDAFERELAALHHVADAVAVSSGTAGLHLSLLVLGIGPGDEVILPSFAFVAVANVVLQVGAIPVFAEIDAHTLNLDPAGVEQRITPRTRAILVVHTFGVPADMTSLQAIADRHGLVIVEDACEAIGARWRSKLAGSFGRMGVFGFYPNKQMTTGEGGAVLVQEAKHAAHLRSLRNQGRAFNGDWLDHQELGFNYRLSEIACALGRVQLRRLPEFLALRTVAAERYHDLLQGMPNIEEPSSAVAEGAISWFVYVVRLREGLDRERVREYLSKTGIGSGRYFPPIHLQPAWRSTPYANVHLPITESIAARTLALPFFNRITYEQQAEVVQALREAIRFA